MKYSCHIKKLQFPTTWVFKGSSIAPILANINNFSWQHGKMANKLRQFILTYLGCSIKYAISGFWINYKKRISLKAILNSSDQWKSSKSYPLWHCIEENFSMLWLSREFAYWPYSVPIGDVIFISVSQTIFHHRWSCSIWSC